MPGYVEDKDEIPARLRRIEGQVRGLQRMASGEPMGAVERLVRTN